MKSLSRISFNLVAGRRFAWMFMLIHFIFTFSNLTMAQTMMNKGANITVNSGVIVNLKGTHFDNETDGASDGKVWNDGSIYVEGDWENNASAGNVFQTNSGLVVLSGISQDIKGASTTDFFNLRLTTAGSTKTLTLMAPGSSIIVGGNKLRAPLSGVLELNSSYLDLNSRTLHITNSSSGAISRIAAPPGLIISETLPPPADVYGIVSWNVSQPGVVPAIYSVPFGNVAREDITFDYTVTTAGTDAGPGATGYMDFSTYPTPETNVPLPTLVNDLTDTQGNTDGRYVINRFWVLTHSGYSSMPVFDYTFRWADIDLVQPTFGDIIEPNLRAQRFNTTQLSWGDKFYADLPNPATNSLTLIGLVDPEDYYAPWTLTDDRFPLPIELIGFKSVCVSNGIKVMWTTASESNSFRFELQRSANNVDFNTVAFANAAGFSSYIIDYSKVDVNPPTGTLYYRLKLIDLDGQSKYSETITINCNYSNPIAQVVNIIDNGNGSLRIVLHAKGDVEHRFILYDGLGKKMTSVKTVPSAGMSTILLPIADVAPGIYYLNIYTDNDVFSKKVLIK